MSLSKSKALAKQRHALASKAMHTPKMSRFNGIERSLPTAHSKTMMALLAKQIEYLPNVEPVKAVAEPTTKTAKKQIHQAKKVKTTQTTVTIEQTTGTTDSTLDDTAHAQASPIITETAEVPKKLKVKTKKKSASKKRATQKTPSPALKIIISIERMDATTDEQQNHLLSLPQFSQLSAQGDNTAELSPIDALIAKTYHVPRETSADTVNLDDTVEQVVISPVVEETPEQIHERQMQRQQRTLTIAYISFFCALLTGVMALPAYFLAWRISKSPDVEVWLKTHCTWIMQNHFIFLSILLFASMWFIPSAFIVWDSVMWVKSMTVIGAVFVGIAWLFLLNAFVKGIGQYLFKKSVV